MRSSSSLPLFLCALTLFSPHLILSTDYTWTGTTSRDWNTATNWSPNGTPSTSDNVFIDGGITNQPQLNLDSFPNPYPINSLTFGSTSSPSASLSVAATGSSAYPGRVFAPTTITGPSSSSIGRYTTTPPTGLITLSSSNPTAFTGTINASGSGFGLGSDFPNSTVTGILINIAPSTLSSTILPGGGLMNIATVGAFDHTLSGVISGAGKNITLLPQSTGYTTTLSNSNNSYGNTSFNNSGGNILAIASAGTGTVSSTSSSSVFKLTLLGDGTLASTVELNPTGTEITVNGTFAMPYISGSGPLTKKGSGKLTLSEDLNIVSSTAVNEGTLVINNNCPHPVSVASRARLEGLGPLAALAISGTLHPATGIGTMSAANVHFYPGSIFEVEISPTQGSLLSLSGPAILGGTVNVVQDAGTYSANEYPIITASSISGSFTGITGGNPGYTFTLDTRGNTLYLLLNGGRPRPSPSSTASLLSVGGLTGNIGIVGNYLNMNPSSATSLLAALPTAILGDALFSVSPSRNSSIPLMAQELSFAVDYAIHSHIDKQLFAFSQPQLAFLTARADDRLMEKGTESGSTVTPWASVFGQFASEGIKNDNPRLHYNAEGLLLGVDYQGISQSLVGLSLGYLRSHYYEKGNLGRGNMDYYLASFYGTGIVQDFYISPSVLGVFTNTHNERFVFFPGFSKTAYASISAFELMPSLEFGYNAKYSNTLMAPFTSASFPVVWQRAYQEKNAAPFNFTQGDTSSSLARSQTGIKFTHYWDAIWGSFYLKEMVSYVFVKPSGSKVSGAFVGTGSSLTLFGLSRNLNLAACSFDALFALGKNHPFTFSLGYEGEFGNNYSSSQLHVKFSKDF